MTDGVPEQSLEVNADRSGAVHVGLNLIFLVPDETGGMEVAARELIPALLRTAPGLRFTAFINREASSVSDGLWDGLLPTVTVPVKACRREQWVFGEQVLLPRLAGRRDVMLLHSLASTAPSLGPFKRVVTIHDLIYARFPDAHAGLRDRGMRVLVPLAVRRSERVIAISESTRADLIELLGTPPEKIDVIPSGLGTIRRGAPLSDGQTRQRFALDDRPVVLTLSAKRPHKNLRRLISALAQIPDSRRPVLILPGYSTWHEAELREHAEREGVVGDVRFEGWVPADELEGLWALADAFVYPSLYEGFGLPVLEAMARGVPVACSNASSLPEVAGDAALMFDPTDQDALSGAIERLLADTVLAARLRERGFARARLFTWERTARSVIDTYARTLGFRSVPLSWLTPTTGRDRPDTSL